MQAIAMHVGTREDSEDTEAIGQNRVPDSHEFMTHYLDGGSSRTYLEKTAFRPSWLPEMLRGNTCLFQRNSALAIRGVLEVYPQSCRHTLVAADNPTIVEGGEPLAGI